MSFKSTLFLFAASAVALTYTHQCFASETAVKQSKQRGLAGIDERRQVTVSKISFDGKTEMLYLDANYPGGCGINQQLQSQIVSQDKDSVTVNMKLQLVVTGVAGCEGSDVSGESIGSSSLKPQIDKEIRKLGLSRKNHIRIDMTLPAVNIWLSAKQAVSPDSSDAPVATAPKGGSSDGPQPTGDK